MKKFIIHVACFFIITIAVIVALVGGTIYILSQASFKIDPSKNILIMGESLTQFGINDTIFERGINLSQNGTAYMYTYCKLKKVLENNPHIDTVLLSFKYGLLERERGERWIMQEDILVSKMAYYISLLGKDEFLVYNDKKILLQAILKVPIRNVYLIIKYFRRGQSNLTYKDLNIGGYLKSNKQEVQRDLKEREQLMDMEYPCEEESPLQKEYLLKIINYCRKHNVKLILISMPTYKPEFYGGIDKTYEYHSKHLNEIQLLDYSNFIMPDESYYRDVLHLNYKGAEVFSNYLQENLVNDLKMLDEKE